MSILSSVTAYQGPLTLLLIIFGPSLLPRLLTFLRIRNSPSPSQITKTPQTPRPLSLKLILGIHTLWVLKQLALPPYNLFASIPVSISNAHLRYIILGPEQPDGNAALHPLVELLLTRMKVMENRMTYLTFGHNPLMECVWCQYPTDYLIFSLPEILGWYILESVFLGILGWNIISGHQASRRAERWRSTFGWALVVGAVGECGIKWIWDLRVIEGDALHLASTIHTIRSIYLLLSPIVYTFLPLPAEHVSPNTLIPIISNTTSTLRLTSLARAAVQRSGKLRETWTTIGMRDSERAEIAKRDEDVRDLVRALQLDEGGMKLSAAQWLREGWNGMIRVDSAPSRGL
ncbi:uncharacterized protein I303_101674 [Kwoniella dejecticola CBS 10117]|uniref:Uncharacterized protein n=1 Tax=Kwoniella dejecticola CBS 10117 TaxID=1296121 RepID=A0A1A6AD44_9TREE|nr:uncharacterized protein I303_02190 [Kwoniella dejecticola CBS 10117]OBR87974.1 hypothetical protein I303_02190 [Kwoniella dejecticola CBS 10117]